MKTEYSQNWEYVVDVKNIFLYTICTTSANAKPTQAVVCMHATSASIQNHRAHFTHDVLSIIQIWWKIHLAEILVLLLRSPQIFTHALSWHVSNFVAITNFRNMVMNEGKKHFTWNLNLDGKILSESNPSATCFCSTSADIIAIHARIHSDFHASLNSW